MSRTLETPKGIIEVEELPNGRRLIRVTSKSLSIVPYDAQLETRYSLELIERVLKAKGPSSLCDEIRREEDPLYTRACIEKDVLGYRTEQDFENKRILDFGCGGGASTIILAKMFPNTEVVGIDLMENLIALADFRAKHFNLNNASFVCSKNSKELPDDIGNFDYILLSAVVEHLLPDERTVILSQLWSLLKPSGVIFINQTPYRFFPFEGHTTRLPLINYLPNKLAFYCAHKFSKRVSPNQDWNMLLRRGIRGSYPKQILGILKKSNLHFKPEILRPSRLGLRDRIDVWYNGYAISIVTKYPKVKRVQKILRLVSKAFYYVSGIVVLPTVSVAIMKREKV
jgi:2-polyprenyl-3-methyl-5-hydroxy-6-metoxy-1,4-benzoquinol methylase